MLKKISPIGLFYLLLLAWVILDVIEAFLFEIHADEAYYQLYANHLAWGYYDHPPMIALLIRLSNLLATGTLGVRLSVVFLHAGTIGLIWKTLDIPSPTYEQVWRFFLLAFPIVMLNAYGFIATPDAPLLFFVALFFYLYKRYLHQPSWGLACGIGVSIALMIYSKYMGVLVIAFVVMSNIKLVKDIRLWSALGIAILLLLPHLWWQYEHQFPSISYHLMARNTAFSILFPLEYIPNQMVSFNPVTFVLMLYAAWLVKRSKNAYERAQAWTIIGFIAFFWLMTFKGHTEPHWTIVAAIPAVALLFEQTSTPIWRKRLIHWMTPMVAIVLITRMVIPTDLVPKQFGFYGKQANYERFAKETDHLPVVFDGSFGDPSLFAYFTSQPTAIVSSLDIRRTQFDIWQEDIVMQGKPAYVTAKWSITPSLQSASRLQIDILNQEVRTDSIVFDLQIHNPYPCDFVFSHAEFPARLLVATLEKDGYHYISGNYSGPDTIRTLSQELYHLAIPYQVLPAKSVIAIQTPLCISANSVKIPKL